MNRGVRTREENYLFLFKPQATPAKERMEESGQNQQRVTFPKRFA
ncbi:hypothetical protein BH24BAC1_BH24BAC1_17880 [soil metagenome]|jgi:hypothetical protein